MLSLQNACTSALLGVVAPGGPRERRSHSEPIHGPCWKRYADSQRYCRTSVTGNGRPVDPLPAGHLLRLNQGQHLDQASVTPKVSYIVGEKPAIANVSDQGGDGDWFCEAKGMP